MRHGNAHRILGRESAERWMLFRNLITELIKHDRIRTTMPKAKEVKRLADKVGGVSRAGKGREGRGEGRARREGGRRAERRRAPGREKAGAGPREGGRETELDSAWRPCEDAELPRRGAHVGVVGRMLASRGARCLRGGAAVGVVGRVLAGKGRLTGSRCTRTLFRRGNVACRS